MKHTLLMFDDDGRTRVSSCKHDETFLPQKLHDKNTERECRGGEQM